MRVYLPATLPLLRDALRDGRLGPAPLRAFAVTPALREWYASGDLEELEYAALSAAARESLRLLHADPAAPRRRVVLAADVADAAVSRPADAAVAEVTVAVEVPLAKVVSAHVDDAEAEPAVAGAAAAVPAADGGDDDAQFTVDEADGFELGWYAAQELAHLVTP